LKNKKEKTKTKRKKKKERKKVERQRQKAFEHHPAALKPNPDILSQYPITP
jgi:hypothetical protein